MYNDKCQRLSVALKSYDDFPQAYYNANDKVREYANSLRWNWRKAELHEVQIQPMLYDMVWAGWMVDLVLKFKPCTNANGKFNSIDEPVDPPADVDIDQEKYDKQQ